jgi:hypothetical protein
MIGLCIQVLHSLAVAAKCFVHSVINGKLDSIVRHGILFMSIRVGTLCHLFRLHLHVISFCFNHALPLRVSSA